MSNLTDQISICCAVNSAIMSDARSKKEFIESSKNVVKKLKIVPPKDTNNNVWPFFNSSWDAYHLYCLIVVPKELYGLRNDDPFYQKLKAKKIFRNFNIIKSEKSPIDNLEYHFRSLRNSISHVNFSIGNDSSYTMWDHLPHKKELEHWRVKISKPNMIIFFEEMADSLFDIYNERHPIS
ncbi:hypothetical protein BAZMOX_258785_0 [methanotrophic endosymbiont of Bathymodiolus azoricus (Menez Gwen)]|nr:hypothetical protein BAZMOX_258785_0 [methanotrophic endosymbiont of Bathymodiolus azoricus (Menez Gwen)]